MYHGTHVEITCTHVEIKGRFWGVSSLPPYWLQISSFFPHGVISFVLIGLLVDSRANQFDNQGSPFQKEMRDDSSEPNVSDLSPGTQI